MKSLRSLFAICCLLLPCARAFAEPQRAWEQWDGCTLAANRYFDGDSFQVKHGDRVFVLRLYFVDAPETDATYAQRIAEQAAYFGVSTAQALHGGQEARDFTARFLSRPFRVFTRMQPAPGASRMERHYAIVERDGLRLDAALVQAGLARVTSEVAAYPDAEAGRRRENELRALEQKAAQSRKGVWGQSKRTDRRETLAEALRPRAPGALPPPHRVNLNTASVADLVALPGIGPKTAEAIIRARPLADFTALDAVPGIGPKKIEALRDLVSFQQP
jgi:DNA uptake protein ComE-like DNA-binding protein